MRRLERVAWRRLRRACMLAAVGAGTAAPTLRAQASADPRFDWFTYQGNDPVYRTIEVGPGRYLNPILAGFYPDPSMVRVGDDFYLVTSTFSYFPGIPVFHSRDLVHWTQIGNVLDRPSQLSIDTAGISRGVFAPVIRYHAGTYYVINTLVDAGGNYIVTATNPAGPWSDPVWLGFDGIDPSLFFDDDGRAWVVNNGPPIGPPLYDGHRAIWIQQFDPVAKQMVGPRKLIVNGGVDLARHPIWIEAPHIFRIGGKYYLFCAEGGTGDQHSEVVFRADSVTGPYVPGPRNPILTQRHLGPNRAHPITSTGHADFVQLSNGDWWAVFLGTRPYRDDMYNTGRETFLMPMRWEDGWPVITSGGETVPWVAPRPGLPRQPAPRVPTSGNFALREDFSGRKLAPYWEFARTPRSSWWSLTEHPGWLTIHARPADLGGHVQPSFIGRRQQHLYASASTAMVYRPARAGDRAGLVAFQNDDYFYFLGVTLDDAGKPVIRLEQHAGRRTPTGGRVLAWAPLRLARSAPIYLRIDARGDSYAFYYGERPGKWLRLQDGADGTILSTRVAGGFVGTMLGMYAFTPGAP